MTSKAKKVQRKEKKTEESQEASKEHHEPTKEAEDTGEKELFQEEKKNPSLYDLLQIEKTATIAEIVRISHLASRLIFIFLNRKKPTKY